MQPTSTLVGIYTISNYYKKEHCKRITQIPRFLIIFERKCLQFNKNKKLS